MKKLIVAVAVVMLAAGTASAGETGTINQAGPYEATMKFYLHPAHGFPGAAEGSQPTADAAAPMKSVDASSRSSAKVRNSKISRTANERRS